MPCSGAGAGAEEEAVSLKHLFVTNLDLDARVEGCEFFFWHEVLFLHQWNVYAYPTIQQHRNLIAICRKGDQVRKFLKTSLEVVSGLRPGGYNDFIGGATNSAHAEGLALDLAPEGMTADHARWRLQPLLDGLQIRMENKPASSWIHIDLRAPGETGRFFTP